MSPDAHRRWKVDQLTCLTVANVCSCSHSVRAELVAALCPIVLLYQGSFVSAAQKYECTRRELKAYRHARMKEDGRAKSKNPSTPPQRILKALIQLSRDPYPDVGDAATSLLTIIGLKVGSQWWLLAHTSISPFVPILELPFMVLPSDRSMYPPTW